MGIAHKPKSLILRLSDYFLAEVSPGREKPATDAKAKITNFKVEGKYERQ